MSSLRYLLPACAASLLLFSHAHAQESDSGKQSVPFDINLDNPIKKDGKWSYDGENDNQDHWGELSEDYAVCLLGIEQSPVDIAYMDQAVLPVLVTLYDSSSAHAFARNNSLEIDVDGNNVLQIDKKSYKLKRITFHSPGEHTVRTKFSLGEVELIHEDDKGNMLIVSSFLHLGETANNALDVILQQMPNKRTPLISIPLTIDPTELLPQKRGYYSYEGSLTTPPCTEHVQWRVMKQPLIVTELQLKALAHFLGRNARSVQPLYNRTIKVTGE